LNGVLSSNRWRRRAVRGQCLFQEVALAIEGRDGCFRFGGFAGVEHELFDAAGGFSCRFGAEVKERAFETVPQAADFPEIARLQGGMYLRQQRVGVFEEEVDDLPEQRPVV
jgi:hypothetical protein